MIASVVYWSEFLVTDPEVRDRFPAITSPTSGGSSVGLVGSRTEAKELLLLLLLLLLLPPVCYNHERLWNHNLVNKHPIPF
jgi:hypothetical protein